MKQDLTPHTRLNQLVHLCPLHLHSGHLLSAILALAAIGALAAVGVLVFLKGKRDGARARADNDFELDDDEDEQNEA